MQVLLGDPHFQSCDIVVCIVTRLGAGWSGLFECWQEQEIYLFSKMPTLAVGPMSGGLPPVPLFAFMVHVGRSFFIFLHIWLI